MISKKIITHTVIIFVLIANIGCDQISKNMVRQRVDYREKINLIGGYFTLTRVENKGALLSLGSGLPDNLKFILLSGIPCLALAFGIFYMFRRKNISGMSMLALSFAIGGGIGNIYDRVVYGSVTDFLHIDLGLIQTGIFNMADVSIVVGMGIFLAQSLYNSKAPVLKDDQTE